jgi:hypothetical protein
LLPQAVACTNAPRASINVIERSSRAQCRRTKNYRR